MPRTVFPALSTSPFIWEGSVFKQRENAQTELIFFFLAKHNIKKKFYKGIDNYFKSVMYNVKFRFINV